MEVGRTGIVVIGPTDSVVGMAAGRTAAAHIVGEAALDSIGFGALDLGKETLVTAGRQGTEVVDQAVVEGACYNPPVLGGMVMRMRRMGQG